MTGGQVLTSIDPLSPAAAIVVLGGEGSSCTRTRYAARLFHQGDSPPVIFSRAFSRNDRSRSLSAQPSREVAQSAGLPAHATMIIDDARSTYDDAVKLRDLTQHYDWHSLIVVTDQFHTVFFLAFR